MISPRCHVCESVIDARLDPTASLRFDELIELADIVIAPGTVEQARLARAAYRDVGRWNGQPARLTFSDHFAYAVAKAMGEPLLFKGDDFGHRDVAAALARRPALRHPTAAFGVGVGCQAGPSALGALDVASAERFQSDTTSVGAPGALDLTSVDPQGRSR